jgi:hypothetical protein
VRSLLIIALCFITFTGVSKGRPGKDKLNVISGQIIDAQTKEGLAGVKVFVEGTSTFTFTDFDGNFTFPAMGSQKIKISTEYVSYYTSEKELEVGKKKKTAIKDPIPVYPIM